MLPSSSYDDQVYLYALANPDWFVAESTAITKLVYEALQIAPSSRRRVYLSPDSGFWPRSTLRN